MFSNKYLQIKHSQNCNSFKYKIIVKYHSLLDACWASCYKYIQQVSVLTLLFVTLLMYQYISFKEYICI